MRQIRFRVWDPIERTMEYPNDDIEEGRATIRLDGRVIPGNWFFSAFEVDEYHHSHPGRGGFVPLELMLSTGLRDKNGREIYEGDLLKFPEARGFYVDVVEWSEREAGFSLFRDDSEYGQSVSAAASEVIGNIYENPDVLYGPTGRRAGLF